MIYEILFSETAKKQIKKLGPVIQRRIINSLERIRINPERYIQKLTDDPAYKLRVGDYRVILDIDRNKLLVLIIKIGHMRNIYS